VNPTNRPTLVSMTARMMAGVLVFLSLENENSRPTKNMSMMRPTNESIPIRVMSEMRPWYSIPKSSMLIFGPIRMPITM
jgi:hypothetical protein